MQILVLQHLSIEHPGVLRDFMDQEGLRWDVVELYKGATIPALEEYTAFICMGGPMDVWDVDAYPWLVQEKAAIRRIVTELKRPFLGICLGHQLLVAALGGKVAPMKAPEVGVAMIDLTPAGVADPLFAGLPATGPALHWHGAEVVCPPKDSTILAYSAQCSIQALRVGSCAYGLQYHVEITEETVSEWGAVPEYKQSLEQVLGRGALVRLEREAGQQIAAFNRSAQVIYHNFRKLF